MERSYAYASANPEVTNKQLDFVKHAFGHMTMTFSKKYLVVHDTEEIDVIIEGKNYPFKFDYSNSEIKYNVCKKSSIQVEYEYLGSTDEYYYTVVNEDLFWVKLESEIGREYFRRVQ